MNSYFALYVKEIKALVKPFIMLLAVYVLDTMSILFTDFAAIFEKGFFFREYYFLKQGFIFGSIFVLPGLFLYSIHDE